MKTLFNYQNSLAKVDNITSELLVGNYDTSENELITIFIPTFKRPFLLREAVDSALNQNTTENYHVVVLDNESDSTTTQTQQIIKTYNNSKLCYYKHSQNVGMAGNWNKAGLLCKTPYFALLHDDDLLDSSFISFITKFLKSNKNADCLCPSYKLFGGLKYDDNKTNKHSLSVKLKRLFTKQTFKYTNLTPNFFFNNVYGAPTCGITFKTSSFIKSGGFNQDLFPSLDWGFLAAFSQKFKLYKTKVILGFYRFSENESLKQETQKKFIEQRITIKNEISRSSIKNKLIFKLIQNDLNKMNDWSTSKIANPSLIYHLFYKYYQFFYR